MAKPSRLYGDPIVTKADLLWAIRHASRVYIMVGNGPVRLPRRQAVERYINTDAKWTAKWSHLTVLTIGDSQ